MATARRATSNRELQKSFILARKGLKGNGGGRIQVGGGRGVLGSQPSTASARQFRPREKTLKKKVLAVRSDAPRPVG